MMAGNPNWWSMHLHPPSQYVVGSSNTSLPEELPQSWSQLLWDGYSGEEERFTYTPSNFQQKRLVNWENQFLNPLLRVPVVEVKQEVTHHSNNLYGHSTNQEFQAVPGANWSQFMAVSSSPSPRSCITSSSSNMLDFSNSVTQPPLDHSFECNSKGSTGGVWKKARVEPSSSQPPLKVRKEKLGDRITALHQLVSPFGKTDTASVLLEAIGYIRFLQAQIQALSTPYLGTTSPNLRNQQYVQGERNISAFHEDQGQEKQEHKLKNLGNRGLCLVPVSCTQQVGSDGGADYWAPPFGGGF